MWESNPCRLITRKSLMAHEIHVKHQQGYVISNQMVSPLASPLVRSRPPESTRVGEAWGRRGGAARIAISFGLAANRCRADHAGLSVWRWGVVGKPSTFQPRTLRVDPYPFFFSRHSRTVAASVAMSYGFERNMNS